jgi:hypothetical protein
MPRYAEVPAGTISLQRGIVNRLRLTAWKLRRQRRAPGDMGGGYSVHQEFGRWTIRPNSGWRSRRWITPPTYAASTEDAVCDYAAANLI